MGKVNLELQKKIRRLMFLKYKKHKKIANLSLVCVFLYSLLVFLILSQFCTIELEISGFIRVCFFIFLVLLLIFMLIFCVYSDAGIHNNVYGTATLKNAFLLLFAFGISLIISFVNLYDASLLNLFLLFLFMSFCFFVICLFSKKAISRGNVLIIYFFFYFVFLWPVVEESIVGIPIFAKILKLLFSISPFLMLLFRSSFTDFLGSGFLIRRWFKIKDSEVWNCPGCRGYIMKKPIRFCPHCGCDTWALDSKSFVHICKNCGSIMKIKELDFPNFCPHCGLGFKSKHPRTYS